MNLQIETGKYYRTRDGRKTPKIRSVSSEGVAQLEHELDGERSVWPDGKIRFDKKECPGDIIAEWRDATRAHIVTHEGREYDLTALETPPCLLPDAVYKSLSKWSHGWVMLSGGRWKKEIQTPTRDWGLVYRAQPAPVEVRVKCHRYQDEFGTPVERGTCIKRADGSIDWSTWRAEK